MDERYEFENAEYRIASIELKAIAYDVVTAISKRKTELIQKTTAKEEIENLLTELNNKSDNLLVLTNQIEESLEALDNLDKQIKRLNFEKKEEVPKPLLQPKEEPKEKETVVIKPIAEKKPLIIPEEEPEEEYDTEVEPAPAVTIELPKEELPIQIKKEVSTQALAPTPIQISTPVDQNTVTTKKQFQKTTKNMSKAIMVKPNQLVNLRKSRTNQEQKLITKGIFLPSSINNPEGHIGSNQPIKQALPDDVERQIEDLTVKANIYYNEGETAKAQELYNQIKALSNQN